MHCLTNCTVNPHIGDWSSARRMGDVRRPKQGEHRNKRGGVRWVPSGINLDAKPQADGRVVGRPALQSEELKRARVQTKFAGRPLEIWVTLCTHQINPTRKITSPRFKHCDPPLASLFNQFDVLTLWTWNSGALPFLEENLAALEKIAPTNARLALGLYLWDYHSKKPVPVDLLQHQCGLGLKWLKAGRIHDLIFLANTVLGVGAPSAEFSRQWIKKVGGDVLSRRRQDF